jgi:hypothetical protein
MLAALINDLLEDCPGGPGVGDLQEREGLTVEESSESRRASVADHQPRTTFPTVPERVSRKSPQISADSQPILSPLSYIAVINLDYKSSTG